MASNNQGNKQSGSPGKGTSNRGFASMDPERQREIASEGGKAAHQKGTAHEFTSEEARRAGSMSHGNRQAAQAGTRSGALRDAPGDGLRDAPGADKEQGGNRQSAGGGSKAGGDKSR